MPKLLLFAPCEKLIVDEEGNPTLITVLQNLGIEVPAGEQVPRDVMTPQTWDVITLWYPEDGDPGKTFHERLEFTQPDGSIPIRTKITFRMEDKTQRNKTHIMGFPIGQAGQSRLNLFLDENGTEPAREPRAFYPINVTHKAKDRA